MKIQTVLGPLDPSKLGATLTHEHLFINSTALALKWPVQDERPFSLEHYDWISRFPYAHKDNTVFYDDNVKNALVEELNHFKENGGGTIVENTTIGISRNVTFLKELSEKTGVNIIAGTGYYVGSSQTESVLSMTTEQIEKTMRDEMLVGCDGTDIRCGILGELGSAWPIEPFERRVLQAAAAIEKDLNCPVITHPGRNREAPFEILRIYQEAGGKVDRLVMCHLDRTFTKLEDFLEFASLGCYNELDLFGVECSYYSLNEDFDMPSDAQRIAIIKALLKEGHEDKIVIAHDLHTKHRLMKFGGHGYSHILKHVVPKMLQREITADQVNKILFDNPRTWLSF